MSYTGPEGGGWGEKDRGVEGGAKERVEGGGEWKEGWGSGRRGGGSGRRGWGVEGGGGSGRRDGGGVGDPPLT